MSTEIDTSSQIRMAAGHAGMLIDMARTASYVPYTNTEQDVIETVFATHMQFPTLPNHTHTKDQGACSLAAVSRSVGKRTMHSDKPVLRAPRSFLEAATRARAAREQAEKEAAKREQQARAARRAIQEQQKQEAWAVRRARPGLRRLCSAKAGFLCCQLHNRVVLHKHTCNQATMRSSPRYAT